MEPGDPYAAAAATAVTTAPPRTEESPFDTPDDDDPWLQLHDEVESRRARSNQSVTFRRAKGGAPSRVPVIVAVVVLVLAVAGGAGWWFFGSGGGSDAEERYFAELSVSGLLSELEKQDFECTPGRTIALCQKTIQGADLSVTVHFASETEVKLIEASGGTGAHPDEEAEPEELEEFFGMAARLPLPAESANRDAAAEWASKHVGEAGEKTFDGVRYEAAGDQPLLTMRPA